MGAWYHIKDADQLDTPALVIYPERAKENIRLLKSMIDDSNRLRPHVKTHKCKETTQLMIDAGIEKFKCATIAEAEMLGLCKAKDVLLAYPVAGPKLHRFIVLVKKYPSTKFSCLVDNFSLARSIANLARSSNIIIPVYIDLNTGMNRTGIRPGKEAIELYIECTRMKGLEVAGLHVYDGHIRNKDLAERTICCEQAFAPVLELKNLLEEEGYQPIIIAGGTPTFPIFAKHKSIECSPGTFIYWDKGYQDSIPDQPFLPAALVITRVVSMPGESILCLDMGYKSIASENELKNRVYFINAPELVIISQSEEHLVVDAGEQHGWKIGDLLYALPVHICPTCAVYDTATTIVDGYISEKWEIIARDRSLTI